jgi:hypothetical protein
MRKFIFLSLCFSAFTFFSSCTKEETYSPFVNQPPQEQPPTVIYSDWTEEYSLSWSDTLFGGEPFLRATWNVPELTQSVIDNGAMLIYAKTNSDGTVRNFPAMIVDQNNTDYETYHNFATVNSFEIFHNKFANGAFEMPSVNNNISFRYVLLENAPPANARIATGSAAGFSIEDLRAMTYQDVAIILGLPN